MPDLLGRLDLDAATALDRFFGFGRFEPVLRTEESRD
jgi:hypothetical protein